MGNVIAVLVISWSFDLRFVFKSSKQAVKDTTGCDDKLIVVGKGVALPRQDSLDAARLRRLHTTHIQVMHQGADTPQTRLIQTKTRSEEHTSELQSLMRISYAVFCLKKKKKQRKTAQHQDTNKIKPIQKHY